MEKSQGVEPVTTNGLLEAKARIFGIDLAPIHNILGIDHRGWRRIEVYNQVFQLILAHMGDFSGRILPDTLDHALRTSGVQFDLSDLKLHEYVVIENRTVGDCVCLCFDGIHLHLVDRICLKIEGKCVSRAVSYKLP